MLYYIKLKEAEDGHPFYNEMGWKDDPSLATVFDTKNAANINAFDEGLDQDEFEIKLLHLADIYNVLRHKMNQYEFIELLTLNDRESVERKYKSLNPDCVPKGVIKYDY